MRCLKELTPDTLASISPTAEMMGVNSVCRGMLLVEANKYGNNSQGRYQPRNIFIGAEARLPPPFCFDSPFSVKSTNA